MSESRVVFGHFLGRRVLPGVLRFGWVGFHEGAETHQHAEDEGHEDAPGFQNNSHLQGQRGTVRGPSCIYCTYTAFCCPVFVTSFSLSVMRCLLEEVFRKSRTSFFICMHTTLYSFKHVEVIGKHKRANIYLFTGSPLHRRRRFHRWCFYVV